MNALKQHPRVSSDIAKGFHWYEDEREGLGHDFAAEVRAGLVRLRDDARLYSVRFAGIQRLNVGRFPYGIFYVIADDEVRVLAVLHAKRSHRRILSGRSRAFGV